MTKFFEVRCTATAEIVELWRVKTRSPAKAIELVDSGQGEFIRQVECGNEEDRRDFAADEIGADEWAALADDGNTLANAAPAMLAALQRGAALLDELRAYDLDDARDVETLAMIAAAIAATTGTPTGEGS